MGRLKPKDRSFFAEWGKAGGRERARRLSQAERSVIAGLAARARWDQRVRSPQPKESVRLQQPNFTDVTYIEELLAEGSLRDWREIYQRMADQPFGATTAAVEKVLSNTDIYGASALWKGIVQTVKGNV